MMLGRFCERCMAPAVFTVVMGTGAFSVATYLMSLRYEWLLLPARIINILNYLLFGIFALRALLSWPRNIFQLRANFERPDSCALYGALGLAIVVLSTQALAFNLGTTIALILWIAGMLATLLLNYGILLRFFLHSHVEMEHVTPVLFVPVASMVVIPVAGAPLSAFLDGTMRNAAIIICLLALGGGLTLYGGLFSLMLQRHLVLAPLPDPLAPTLWIHLAPIGWAGVALISLAQFALPTELANGAKLLALLFFGGASWWFIMASLLCLRTALKGTLKFSMSWWSFIFPMGSITILSSRLEYTPTQALFPFLWTILALMWSLCAIKSIFFITGSWRESGGAN